MEQEIKSELENKMPEVNISKEQRVSMEEALTRTKFGKYNIGLLILSGLILSTVLLETLSVSYILPVTDCDLKLNSKEKGLLSGIAFAGIIASLHLWGFLADTQVLK